MITFMPHLLCGLEDEAVLLLTECLRYHDLHLSPYIGDDAITVLDSTVEALCTIQLHATSTTSRCCDSMLYFGPPSDVTDR
jgi:hypothetical protein